MSGDETPSDRSRESGVDLGELSDALDQHEYPTSTEELIAEYGDHEIELPNGSETLEQVLGPMADDTFDSADSVRQAIFNMVGAEAVGRKGYTDRGGASEAMDDDDLADESF